MRSGQYEVRRVNSEDVMGLVSLFKETFNKGVSPEFYYWRLFNNPLKLSWGFVATHKDKIIAFASLTPQQVIYRGKEFIIGTSGSSMVSPDFQRLGIYSKLARVMYKRAYDQHCNFICGFPNRNSHYGRVVKLNWFNICEIPQLSNKIRCISQSKNSISDYEIISVDKLERETINECLEKRLETYYDTISLREDYTFFKWRYIEHPSYNYYVFKHKKNFENFIIKFYHPEKDGKQIDILTVNVYEKRDLEELICGLILYCEASEIGQINLWLNCNDKFYTSFEKFGFYHSSPITWFSGLEEPEGFTFFYDCHNWNFSFALSDVY